MQTLFRPLVSKFVLNKSSIFKIRSQQFTALNRISGLGFGIILNIYKDGSFGKVQVSNDQKLAQSERNSHSKI